MTTSSPPFGAGQAGTSRAPLFGQMVTAMITPMTPDGAVDYDGAARLAEYLVTNMRNDGLVVNGTTGEAPTTTDAEKERLLARGARGGGQPGQGDRRGRHQRHRAHHRAGPQAERAGAHGLLVVTPYYNKPPQAGPGAPTSPRSPTRPACR